MALRRKQMATKTPTFKVYLAGKVTGEDFNAVKAKFAKKQRELEALGYKVVNPVTAINNYFNTNIVRLERFSVEELRLAGLVSDGGNLIFYKHKIIIPFLQDGRIVFLQGRRLDQGQPKYLHTRRPVPLYNQDALVEAEEGQKVYITEGVFDAMMLEQNGYSAVGILGVNNFKQDYISLFKKFKVVLALDNDEAGKEATKRLAKMFYEQGQRVNSIQLPNGVKDVSDYLGGKE